VLSLILRRGKSYADIAEALELDEGAVRERAQAALVALAPDLAGAVADSEREQIGDYLLGQQSAAQRLVTYDAIEGSDGASAYAAALSGALADVSGGALPEVPPTSPAVSPSGVPSPAPRRPREPEPTAARSPRQSAPVRAAAAQGSGARAASATSRDRLPSSRRGGAAILAAIAIAAIVAVVLATTSGGGTVSKGKAAAAVSASTGATGASGSAQVRFVRAIKLTAADGAETPSGEAVVLSEAGKQFLALEAKHLAPSQGFFYAAWLYNSQSQAFALGKAPEVGPKGHLSPVAQALPANAASFHMVIVTKQTTTSPAEPGEIVLSGVFSAH
jgi:hypothetical protein